MKTDLLKDAIADADAIKKLAIENAKVALNETFDSKVKSMLAAKLQEEAEDAEDELEEEYEEEQDEAKKAKHAEPDADNEGGKSDGDEDNEEADESFDIDAILAEMEDEEEEADEARKPAEEEEEEADEARKPAEEEEEAEEAEEEEEEEEEDADESIDLDALIAEMSKEEDEEEDQDEAVDSVDEYTGLSDMQGDLAALLGIAVPAAGALVAVLGGKAKEFVDKLKAAKDKKGAQASTSSPSAQEELQEIRRQAKKLAQKVNETNLINAKLLYLNKVLRSNNLSENQKIKVVAAFDKASSVKEAKIVFESLSGALSLKNETKKTSLKESFGFASKPAGTSTKRQVEDDKADFAKRWQHLAGLNKKR